MADLEALTREYLDAFEARDVERCLSFFADDAAINFQGTVYRGPQAINEWHKDRFAANLRLTQLEKIRVNGDAVEVDGVASSDRLAAWKIKSLKGHVSLRFEDGKIKEGSLTGRITSLFDMLRAGE